MGPSITELVEQLTIGQLAQFSDDKPWLRQFVTKYEAILLDVEPNTENPGSEELVYFFDDSLGGYTIKAIKNSSGGKVYYL